MPLISGNRHSDWNARQWMGLKPPRDWGDTFRLGFKQAWDLSIAQNQFDYFTRPLNIMAIQNEHERNREIIPAEQAIREYPNSAKVIKKPVTRAEAIYWAREQEGRDKLNRAFAGKYEGTAPEISALVGGALGANVVDPVNWALAFATYGASLSIPAARNSLAIANLVNSAAKSRMAAGAFMAMDGAIGGALAGAVAKPFYSANQINYGMGEYAADIFAGSLFGAGIGLGFPKTAAIQKPLIGTKNSADYIATLFEVKKAMAAYGSKDILDFMGNTRGFMAPGEMISRMAGRRQKEAAKYPGNLDAEYRKKVREAEVEFLDRGGLVKRTEASKLHDFSEFSARAKSGYLKTSGRFSEIGIGQGGILSWRGQRFRYPRKFYNADLDSPTAPRPKEVEKGNLVFYELFTPYTRGEIGGLQSGVKHFGATTAEEAAYIHHLSNPGRNIDVGKIQFEKPLFLFNMDHKPNIEQFRLTWNRMMPKEAQTFSAKDLDSIEKAGSWAKVPERLKAKVMKAMRVHPSYDGIGYKRGKAWVAELNKVGVRKASKFSDKYLAYDMRRENPDPQYLHDMVTGKHPDSIPPAVQDLMDDFYAGRTVEGVDYFESFVKRRSPLSEDIYQDGSAPMEVRYKDFTFKDTDIFVDPKINVGKMATGVPFPGAAILQRVVRAVEGVGQEGVPGFDPKKYKKIKTVRDAIRMTSTSNLPALHAQLKKEGFVFADAVPYNFRGDQHFFTNDSVVLARKAQGNMLQRVFFDAGFPDNVKISMPARTLDISVHPSVMTPEELQLALGLVEDGQIPDVSEINRNTLFTGGKQAIMERAGALRGMGVAKVKFRHARGDLEVEVGGTPGAYSVGDLKARYAELAKRKAAPLGPDVKPNERAAEYKEMFSKFRGDSRSFFFVDLLKGIRAKVSGVDSVEALNKAETQYHNFLKAADNMEPGTPRFLEVEGKIRQLESSFRKMSAMVDNVANSNIGDAETRLGQWWQKMTHHSEVLGVIGTTIDTPYWSLGGDNIDITRRSQARKYHTALIRGLEEIGGSDLVWMAQSGVFDEDLLKIKYYRMMKRKESQGLSGKLKEQTEELEVSPLAWKVYNHLETVMQGLQKELSDSGFYREPRFDYIGTRFYDLRAIQDTAASEFVADTMKFTTMDEKAAITFYNDLRESHTIIYKDRNRPLGDVTDKLVHSQKVDFKDAASEFAFLKKYGGLRDVFSNSVIAKSDPRGGSAIFTGAVTSIHRDSNLMAINSFLGSRPLLTLDLMFGAIAKKVRSDVSDGARLLKASDRKFKSSQKHAENMLDSLIFPARASFSKASETRKVLRAVQNVGKLFASLPRIFFGDLASSSAAMSKLKNFKKDGSDALFATSMKLLEGRIKTLRPKTRAEVGRRFNTLLSMDTRNFAGRFESDTAGITSWLESLSMRAYGIAAATDIAKTGNSAFLGHWLAEAFNVPWNGLKDDIQNQLRTFGFTPEFWDEVRQIPNLRESHDGVDLVFLDTLGTRLREYGEGKNWTTKQINDAYRAFDTFFVQKAEEKGVPMQGIYEASWFDINRHDPDSILSNIGKLLEQFKSIGVAAARVIFGEMTDNMPGKRSEFRLQRVAKVAAYMTVMSALALQTRNLMLGRTTQEMDANFWMDSMAAGGTFGLFGDVLLSDFTSDQRGFMQFMLGPALGGTVPDSLAAVRHVISDGDLEKAKKDAMKVIRGATPKAFFGQDFLFNVFFLRSLGALGDSITSKNKEFEKRRMKELGYDYIAR